MVVAADRNFPKPSSRRRPGPSALSVTPKSLGPGLRRDDDQEQDQKQDKKRGSPTYTQRPRGFTLMETLVMLIISALAVTLMMQALSSFNRSREHIVRLEGVRDNDAVALGWLGDSLRGLVSVPSAAQPGKVIEASKLADSDHAGGNGLKGDANGFSAQTLTPLLGPPGVPVTVQWQVVRDTGGDSLAYREPGHPPMILPLNDADALAFSYLDSDGKVHDTWPPKLGLQDPMPQTIQLQIGHGDHVRVLARSPTAPQPMVLTPYAPPEDE